MTEPTTEAGKRPPYVLRLTGEQIGSIDPPPDGDFFTDWDEYEDYVPLRMLDEAVNATLDKVAAALPDPSLFDYVKVEVVFAAIEAARQH